MARRRASSSSCLRSLSAWRRTACGGPSARAATPSPPKGLKVAVEPGAAVLSWEGRGPFELGWKRSDEPNPNDGAVERLLEAEARTRTLLATMSARCDALRSV